MQNARVNSMAVAVRDDLVSAIQRDGRSVYEIARQTGVPQSSLSRFINGERGLSFESLESLASVLGLELRVTPRRPRKRSSKKS